MCTRRLFSRHFRFDSTVFHGIDQMLTEDFDFIGMPKIMDIPRGMSVTSRTSCIT